MVGSRENHAFAFTLQVNRGRGSPLSACRPGCGPRGCLADGEAVSGRARVLAVVSLTRGGSQHRVVADSRLSRKLKLFRKRCLTQGGVKTKGTQNVPLHPSSGARRVLDVPSRCVLWAPGLPPLSRVDGAPACTRVNGREPRPTVPPQETAPRAVMAAPPSAPTTPWPPPTFRRVSQVLSLLVLLFLVNSTPRWEGGEGRCSPGASLAPLQVPEWPASLLPRA